MLSVATLWIPFTIIAALGQVARNAMQRSLTGPLGTWGATCAAVGVTSLVDSTLSVIPNAIMVAGFTAAVAAHASLDHPPLRFWKRLLALPLAAVLAGLLPVLVPLARASVLDAEAHRDVKAGRYADAVDAFRRAAAADPLNGETLPYFGDLMADLYLRRIDTGLGGWRTARARAEALYVRAARLSPWDGYARAALGRLRRAEGRDPEAAAAFREAVALDPYSPRYRLWLGEALLSVGDRRGAVGPLREAARLYPIELLVIERHEGHGAAYAQDQADLGRDSGGVDHRRHLFRKLWRGAEEEILRHPFRHNILRGPRSVAVAPRAPLLHGGFWKRALPSRVSVREHEVIDARRMEPEELLGKHAAP